MLLPGLSEPVSIPAGRPHGGLPASPLCRNSSTRSVVVPSATCWRTTKCGTPVVRLFLKRKLPLAGSVEEPPHDGPGLARIRPSVLGAIDDRLAPWTMNGSPITAPRWHSGNGVYAPA